MHVRTINVETNLFPTATSNAHGKSDRWCCHAGRWGWCNPSGMCGYTAPRILLAQYSRLSCNSMYIAHKFYITTNNHNLKWQCFIFLIHSQIGQLLNQKEDLNLKWRNNKWVCRGFSLLDLITTWPGFCTWIRLLSNLSNLRKKNGFADGTLHLHVFVQERIVKALDDIICVGGTNAKAPGKESWSMADPCKSWSWWNQGCKQNWTFDVERLPTYVGGVRESGGCGPALTIII